MPKKYNRLRQFNVKQQKIDQIMPLWDAGESVATIAETVGVSENTVRRVLKLAGVGQSDSQSGLGQ